MVAGGNQDVGVTAATDFFLSPSRWLKVYLYHVLYWYLQQE